VRVRRAKRASVRKACNTGRAEGGKAGPGRPASAHNTASRPISARASNGERYDELGNNDTGKSDVNVFGRGLRLSF